MAEVARLFWDLNELPSLFLAQKIFVADQAEIAKPYLDAIDPVFFEPIEALPFATEPSVAAKRINDWVAEQTGGLIQGAVGELNPSTVCALVSTLYFRGYWQNQFSKEKTNASAFRLDDGSEIEVPMMQLEKAHLNHFRMENARGVVLPYRDDTEMVLLLPDGGHRVSELWADLDPQIQLGAYPDDLLYVTVELPRFEFRATNQVLNRSLAEMGLEQVLKGSDLSPMLTLNPPEPIGLSMYQTTYLRVDESGTEAAAATVAMASPASTRTPGEPRFITIRFDRPFGFFLRHSKTGAILLIGRVDEPEHWVP